MTLSLTATPSADGTVALVVTDAVAGAVILSRADGNGFGVVRQPVGIALSGVRSLPDAEASLTGAVRYLVQDVSGATATASCTFDALAVTRQLRRVFRPESRVSLEAVEGIDAARELRRSEHAPVGRPDVVFTTYRMGLRRGVMRLQATGNTAVSDILRLYADGQVCMIRLVDHRALDMYHVALNVSSALREVTPAGVPVWTVSVTYAETRPSDASTVAYWTCADVLARYPTAVVAGLPYGTWADLIDDRMGS